MYKILEIAMEKCNKKLQAEKQVKRTPTNL